ncbi:hypothetical protein ACFQ6Q_28960 [Streptomyces sp. NPDC056437]|uniref:hypothetical protein n=1 Tax=Streptomyces sp. NPDC056437 TaxID=3345816 RepID=UPI0036CDD8EE
MIDSPRPEVRKAGLPNRVRLGGGVCAVALVGVLAGCGSVDEREAAIRSAVEQFDAAAAAKDGASLCAALAPGTRSELEDSEQQPCAEAVAGLRLPAAGAVSGVDVYGQEARVVAAGDTLFLSRFAGGWKVVAAGCRPELGRPYQCAVKGG